MRVIFQGVSAFSAPWRKKDCQGWRGLSDVLALRKLSEHPAGLSIFRQEHRSFMSALACKIE
jgi:hypothetical protein